MNIELLDILRCPFCGARLELVSSMFHRSISDQIHDGILGCECCIFPVVDGIPVLGSLFGPPVSGASFFTAGIILAFMITPIVTSLSREVIATTPTIDKEGAYALGATRLEMIRGTVWPHSKGGVTGAVLLGLGRAMGETIAAALVIGSSATITSHLFAPGYNMPSVIANEFGEASGVFRSALMGLGVLLFAFTIIINIVARGIVERSARRQRGA